MVEEASVEEGPTIGGREGCEAEGGCMGRWRGVVAGERDSSLRSESSMRLGSHTPMYESAGASTIGIRVAPSRVQWPRARPSSASGRAGRERLGSLGLKSLLSCRPVGRARIFRAMTKWRANGSCGGRHSGRGKPDANARLFRYASQGMPRLRTTGRTSVSETRATMSSEAASAGSKPRRAGPAVSFSM
jgi:hypothetical protein